MIGKVDAIMVLHNGNSEARRLKTRDILQWEFNIERIF